MSAPRPTNQVRPDRWALHAFDHEGVFRAPAGPYLSGEVHGDSRFEDGASIMTGEIVGCDDTAAWTGRTCYLLGEPDPGYLAWLGTKGRILDPERPMAGVVL